MADVVPVNPSLKDDYIKAGHDLKEDAPGVFYYYCLHSNTYEPLVAPVPKLTWNTEGGLGFKARDISAMSLPDSIRQRARESLDHLASIPMAQWGLKEELLNEEIKLIHSRPPPGQEPSQESKDISDYTPTFASCGRKYSRDWYAAKWAMVRGPFEMPDPLAFHLVCVLLCEADESAITILDNQVQMILEKFACEIIDGKPFWKGLSELRWELYFSAKRMEAWTYKLNSQIGYPLRPPQRYKDQAKEMRKNGTVPERLYTSLELLYPQYNEKMMTQRWNIPLAEVIREITKEANPVCIPEDYMKLNQNNNHGPDHPSKYYAEMSFPAQGSSPKPLSATHNQKSEEKGKQEESEEESEEEEEEGAELEGEEGFFDEGDYYEGDEVLVWNAETGKEELVKVEW